MYGTTTISLKLKVTADIYGNTHSLPSKDHLSYANKMHLKLYQTYNHPMTMNSNIFLHFVGYKGEFDSLYKRQCKTILPMLFEEVG